MVGAQAETDSLILVSGDAEMRRYEIEVLW
jgi:hypothetical protein